MCMASTSSDRCHSLITRSRVPRGGGQFSVVHGRLDISQKLLLPRLD